MLSRPMRTTMMDVAVVPKLISLFFASLLGGAAVATAAAASDPTAAAPSVVVVGSSQTYEQASIRYSVVMNVPPQDPGRVAFENEFGGEANAKRVMRAACGTVLNALGQSYTMNKKGYTDISLHLDDWDWMKERAAARADGNEIHLSSTYVDYVSAGGSNPTYTKEHLTGVLYHEMTHVWQWLGEYGVNPDFSGLAEGMAEYVSIVSGYNNCRGIQPDFTKAWYEFPCHTADFLIYCARLRPTFVGDINEEMEKRNRYLNIYFYLLLRKTVEQLWKDYMALPRPYLLNL